MVSVLGYLYHCQWGDEENRNYFEIQIEMEEVVEGLIVGGESAEDVEEGLVVKGGGMAASWGRGIGVEEMGAFVFLKHDFYKLLIEVHWIFCSEWMQLMTSAFSTRRSMGMSRRRRLTSLICPARWLVMQSLRVIVNGLVTWQSGTSPEG